MLFWLTRAIVLEKFDDAGDSASSEENPRANHFSRRPAHQSSKPLKSVLKLNPEVAPFTPSHHTSTITAKGCASYTAPHLRVPSGKPPEVSLREDGKTDFVANPEPATPDLTDFANSPLSSSSDSKTMATNTPRAIGAPHLALAVIDLNAIDEATQDWLDTQLGSSNSRSAIDDTTFRALPDEKLIDFSNEGDNEEYTLNAPTQDHQKPQSQSPASAPTSLHNSTPPRPATPEVIPICVLSPSPAKLANPAPLGDPTAFTQKAAHINPTAFVSDYSTKFSSFSDKWGRRASSSRGARSASGSDGNTQDGASTGNVAIKSEDDDYVDVGFDYRFDAVCDHHEGSAMSLTSLYKQPVARPNGTHVLGGLLDEDCKGMVLQSTKYLAGINPKIDLAWKAVESGGREVFVL